MPEIEPETDSSRLREPCQGLDLAGEEKVSAHRIQFWGAQGSLYSMSSGIGMSGVFIPGRGTKHRWGVQTPCGQNKHYSHCLHINFRV